MTPGQRDAAINRLLGVLGEHRVYLPLQVTIEFRACAEGILSGLDNAQKSSDTGSLRNDQPWGCVIGPRKHATGSTAQITGAV